jgi:hypothetical protein
LDDYVSNLTNAFQTLDATGGSSASTDDLSYSLMMLNSPNSREREQALIKIVNVSVEGESLFFDLLFVLVCLLNLILVFREGKARNLAEGW